MSEIPSTMLSADPADRRLRARLSLEGLSIGDAFGQRFFRDPDVVEQLVAERRLPWAPWPFTDDTNMALSIVACLYRHGQIDQDWLAASFAERYDIGRGYGPAMHRLLARVRHGEPWRGVARSLFEGRGSFGNGAAMRVAPLGAYFADDLPRTVEQAHASAEVTHTHPDASAGAIAVAVAAALACRLGGSRTAPEPVEFIDMVREHVPAGAVADGLQRARDLRPRCAPRHAAIALGSGNRISAQDTVPFVIWCAAHTLDDFTEAMWATVSGLGDRDTTCAMVGGIVAGFVGVEGVPGDWQLAREPLPAWAFETEDV